MKKEVLASGQEVSTNNLQITAKNSRQLRVHSFGTFLAILIPVYTEFKGAFFWDYSGIGILGVDGICVLLGAIPFSE